MVEEGNYKRNEIFSTLKQVAVEASTDFMVKPKICVRRDVNFVL